MNRTSLALSAAILCLVTVSWSQPAEESVLNRAYQLYDAADYEGCLRQLNVLPLADRKAGAEVYHLLGLCQLNLEKYQESILSFGTSLAKDPKVSRVYYGRAHAFLKLQRYRESARDFEMTLKLYSGDNATFVNEVVSSYCYSLINSGETEKGIRYLEEHHNDDADLVHALAYYTLEYRKDPEQAMVYWELAVTLDPKHRSAMENLSISYYETGDYNMAFYYIEKLIEHHPDYGRAHYIRGACLQEIGEEADALIAFQRASELGYVEEE